jgi:ketosteroid isomerase-like protein
MKYAYLLPLILFLTVPTRAVHAQIVPGAPTTDWNRQRQEFTAEVLKAYDRTMKEWRDAWHKGDIKAVADFYLDDALLFVGDTVPLQGKDNVLKQLQRMVPNTVEMRTGLSDFVASDRLAYALGPFYWETRESAGATATRVVTGTVVTIMVRDGRRWKIRSQILRPQANNDTP